MPDEQPPPPPAPETPGAQARRHHSELLGRVAQTIASQKHMGDVVYVIIAGHKEAIGPASAGGFFSVNKKRGDPDPSPESVCILVAQMLAHATMTMRQLAAQTADPEAFENAAVEIVERIMDGRGMGTRTRTITEPTEPPTDSPPGRRIILPGE